MLTASLTVRELPPDQQIAAVQRLMAGESGAQRYEVLTSPDALYLVRPGAPTRFVLLEELLEALAYAEPTRAGQGGGR